MEILLFFWESLDFLGKVLIFGCRLVNFEDNSECFGDRKLIIYIQKLMGNGIRSFWSNLKTFKHFCNEYLDPNLGIFIHAMDF